MKFTAVASALLLAGTAVAAPGTAMRRARAAERASRKTVRPTYIEGTEFGIETNNTSVQYSDNWAGAVVETKGVKSVTASFTVPTPSSAGSGSAWVGIDGNQCATAILQTGIDWTKSGSSITYHAWYEWYPDYAYDFPGIPLHAGDSITVTVTATSKTAGTAVIKNTTTGKSVTHTFSNEGSGGSLCQTDAEWIVEAYESHGGQVNLANFGTITFSDAKATTSSGTVTPSQGTIIDMKPNHKVVTGCSSTSSTVKCTYTGQDGGL